MAASQALLIVSLCLSSAVLFSSSPAQAQPAPPPPPLNLIDMLQKAGQYSTLIRLLGTTRVGNQLADELNNSYTKATFFSPTDAAFNSLPSGLLNASTMEQQVKLLNFHVVPHLFTWNDFRNGVPPQQTQASGPNGPYDLTFTFVSNQHAKVSTGVMETIFSNALNLTPPLAIYQVDKVLIPPGLFSTSSAPSSSPAPGSGSAPSSSASPSPSSSEQPHAPSSSSSPPPSTPSPNSSSPPTHAPPSKSAPSPTTPHASAPGSGSAPASTSTETGSAPAGALGLWSLTGILMAAAVAAMV